MAGMQMAAMGVGRGDVVTIPPVSPFDIQISPTDAQADLTLLSNGTYTATGQVGGSWINPTSSAGLYEARATVVSGTFNLGTFNTWLALTSNRSWGCGRDPVGINNAELTLEIRVASSGTVVASGNIVFSAEVDT